MTTAGTIVETTTAETIIIGTIIAETTIAVVSGTKDAVRIIARPTIDMTKMGSVVWTIDAVIATEWTDATTAMEWIDATIATTTVATRDTITTRRVCPMDATARVTTILALVTTMTDETITLATVISLFVNKHANSMELTERNREASATRDSSK